MSLPLGHLFALGRTLITPAAIEELRESGDDPGSFLKRHVTGDCGDLDAEDKELWMRALAEDDRLLSVYHNKLGNKIYVITEWDRSVTTILLPRDY